jgi:sec-independent protein translocase protein TatB
MLDFGFSEILLTSAIALVVLGPERLPKVARQLGNWMGRARVMARQLGDQLEREVNAEQLIRDQMKSPLRPDQPALPPSTSVPARAATFSEPVVSGSASETVVSAAASQPAVSQPAAAPEPSAVLAPAAAPRLPDGHATTVEAMHPPAPPVGTDPHPNSQ